jgi:hypothetical protein
MKYRQTSSITSKRKVNLNNNNSGNSDSNGNNHTTQSTNDSNNIFSSNNTNNNTNNNNTNNNNSSSNTNPSNSSNGNKNNYTRNFKSESSESSQEDEVHITPRSLIGMNETPRRLTPSRRDSYNRNSSSSSSSSNSYSGNLVKTPKSAGVSSSIFNFSNLISDQKQLQQKKINEEAILMQSTNFIKNRSISDELKSKLKSEMSVEEKVFDSGKKNSHLV